jgi:hypothetical protein
MTEPKDTPGDSPETSTSLTIIEPAMIDDAYRRGYQDAIIAIHAAAVRCQDEFRMSHGHFSLTCMKCGHTGEIFRSLNGWGDRHTAAVRGFEHIPSIGMEPFWENASSAAHRTQSRPHGCVRSSGY